MRMLVRVQAVDHLWQIIALATRSSPKFRELQISQNDYKPIHYYPSYFNIKFISITCYLIHDID